MENFNGLNNAESERIALLLEEFGEVQQAIGKILRHGFENRHPSSTETNREELEREIGDVFCAVSMMAKKGDVNMEI